VGFGCHCALTRQPAAGARFGWPVYHLRALAGRRACRGLRCQIMATHSLPPCRGAEASISMTKLRKTDGTPPIDPLGTSGRGQSGLAAGKALRPHVRSPFTFFRGAAGLMAHDLAATPDTGIRVQACGDCHLMNFGLFATPNATWCSTSTILTRPCPRPGSGTSSGCAPAWPWPRATTVSLRGTPAMPPAPVPGRIVNICADVAEASPVQLNRRAQICGRCSPGPMRGRVMPP